MDPSPHLVQRDKLDQSRAFFAYCLTGGNVGRTSILCRTSDDIIESLAHDFNWKDRISTLVRTDTDEGLAEQKALNRLSVFMVAERMKQVISGIIDRLHSDPEAAAHMCVEVKRIPGTEETEVTFKPKALTDLTDALEKVANISYRALGDKVAQEADTNGGPENAAHSAASVYQALMNRFERIPKVIPAAEVSKVLNAG